MIHLNQISKIAFKNAEKRRKNGAFGNVKSDTMQLLKHCATEVIEATEALVDYREMKNLAEDLTATDIEEKWASQEEPDACEEFYQESRKRFISELADIITCVLIIAAKENIDIEKAIHDVTEKNERRAAGIGDKL